MKYLIKDFLPNYIKVKSPIDPKQPCDLEKPSTPCNGDYTSTCSDPQPVANCQNTIHGLACYETLYQFC